MSDAAPHPREAAGAHGGPPATSAAVERASAHDHADAGVDEASDESFPASDPPASTRAHAGPPAPRPRPAA
jgi:hypothetical protein